MLPLSVERSHSCDTEPESSALTKLSYIHHQSGCVLLTPFDFSRKKKHCQESDRCDDNQANPHRGIPFWLADEAIKIKRKHESNGNQGSYGRRSILVESKQVAVGDAKQTHCQAEPERVWFIGLGFDAT